MKQRIRFSVLNVTIGLMFGLALLALHFFFMYLSFRSFLVRVWLRLTGRLKSYGYQRDPDDNNEFSDFDPPEDL